MYSTITNMPIKGFKRVFASHCEQSHSCKKQVVINKNAKNSFDGNQRIKMTKNSDGITCINAQQIKASFSYLNISKSEYRQRKGIYICHLR